MRPGLGGLQDVVGRHIVKVEPLNAILDPQYFVRAVHGCVLAVLRARSEKHEQHSADNSGFRYSWHLRSVVFILIVGGSALESCLSQRLGHPAQLAVADFQ